VKADLWIVALFSRVEVQLAGFYHGTTHKTDMFNNNNNNNLKITTDLSLISKILWVPDDDAQVLKLLSFWTLYIVKYFKQENTTFRELNILPSSGTKQMALILLSLLERSLDPRVRCPLPHTRRRDETQFPKCWILVF
jgi:hypothetical protein